MHDAASYATRTAGVGVSIDGVANDGSSADGTGDNVKTNIENLVGGSGADTLSGSAANNRLTGGLGTDSLFGSGGDDILLANDGVADTTIDSDGGSSDIAHVDSLDPAPVGCETWGP